MGKLFRLKRWLTLNEAATHISMVVGEPVGEADVLRLALDGKIQLSAVFVGGMLASSCKCVSDEYMREHELQQPEGRNEREAPNAKRRFAITTSTSHDMYEVLDEVIPLDGDEPYRLLMLGGDYASIDARYWQLIGGPVVHAEAENGIFISDGEQYFQLKARLSGLTNTFIPLGSLPRDVAIVVTPMAILEFESELNQQSSKDDVSEPPYFDADSSDYPELLHIAVRAWEHAKQTTGQTPKQRIIAYVSERYPQILDGPRDAIATVANWHKAGGRPKKGG